MYGPSDERDSYPVGKPKKSGSLQGSTYEPGDEIELCTLR